MPLITPPSDEAFKPEPVEPEKISQEEVYWREGRARIYADCLNWKCPECGCVVFGRCKTCPYCRFKLGKITERLKDWKAHAE